VTDLLVTATDTGVGKTVVAAALIVAMRERGLRAVGFKPAETGLTGETLSDSEVLAKASGFDTPLARPLLRLEEALAPAVAADRAGVSLDPAQVDERLRALHSQVQAVVVEGAGGVHVPLAWNYTVLDMAVRHKLETIVVGRTGLGTLNHCVLTFEALRSRRIPIRAFVLNGLRPDADLAEETNATVLRRLLPAIPVLVVPRHRADDTLEAAYATVPYVANLAT